jgi:hypothetical protein
LIGVLLSIHGIPLQRVNNLESSPNQVGTFEKATANVESKQDQVFAAKRRKIRKVLMFPLLRPLRFLWLMFLLPAFTDER